MKLIQLASAKKNCTNINQNQDKISKALQNNTRIPSCLGITFPESCMSINYQPTHTAIVLTYATKILFFLIALIKNLACEAVYVVPFNNCSSYFQAAAFAPTSPFPFLGHRRCGHSPPGQQMLLQRNSEAPQISD